MPVMRRAASRRRRPFFVASALKPVDEYSGSPRDREPVEMPSAPQGLGVL